MKFQNCNEIKMKLKLNYNEITIRLQVKYCMKLKILIEIRMKF